MTTCPGGVAEWWRLRPLWLVPVAVLGILPLAVVVDTKEAKCAYVLLVMAVLWLTEAIPIAATALLPVFMFPMAGVQAAPAVSMNYIKDTSILITGSLMMAVAVEEWKLHKRIALGILSIMGTNPMWLMLGLMLPTWFLSLWMCNSATTSMMIPIVAAILRQLKPRRDTASEEDTAVESNEDSEEGVPMDEVKVVGNGCAGGATRLCQFVGPVQLDLPTDRQELKSSRTYAVSDAAEVKDEEGADAASPETVEYTRLCKGMSLCIAYAANIGGIGTLIGTVPNLILQGQLNSLYAKYGLESELTFAGWIVLALPLSVLTLTLAWLWLVLLFARGGCRRFEKRAAERVKRAITRDFTALGPLSFAEGILAVLFVFLLVLWLSRDPKMVAGWASWFPKGYVTDSSAAVLVAVLLFILPARPLSACCQRESEGAASRISYTPLLTWEMVQHRLPWGILILLGGGFAIADACKVSGLSAWLGSGLATFQHFQPWVVNLVLCTIVAAATEVTTNPATASLVLPILAELAIQIGVSPLYLMVSCVIAASFSFMTPVATPPNAIVFSHGYLRISDMASAGLVMNVMSILCLTLAVNTWGNAYFDFHTLPDAFLNGTVAA